MVKTVPSILAVALSVRTGFASARQHTCNFRRRRFLVTLQLGCDQAKSVVVVQHPLIHILVFSFHQAQTYTCVLPTSHVQTSTMTCTISKEETSGPRSTEKGFAVAVVPHRRRRHLGLLLRTNSSHTRPCTATSLQVRLVRLHQVLRHCVAFFFWRQPQVCKHRLASVSRLLTVLAGAISSFSFEVVGDCLIRPSIGLALQPTRVAYAVPAKLVLCSCPHRWSPGSGTDHELFFSQRRLGPRKLHRNDTALLPQSCVYTVSSAR